MKHGGIAGAISGHLLSFLAISLAIVFVGSSLFATYRSFSPVPFADSWSGMVDFYVKSFDDPAVWWAQHNEHRILLSKLFFWVDMRFFSGSGALLVPVNILLLASIWAMLCVYARRLLADWLPTERVPVYAMLAMPCISWMQSQNILFSFQSMFILAFLLPLLSFYCYARALEAPQHAARWRWLSLALGAACTQCMANGLFVLPVLAVFSGCAERSPRRVLVILAWAGTAAALFLIGYEKSPAGSLGLAVLLVAPWEIVKFALAYVGNPLFSLFQRDLVPIVGGGVAVVLATYMFLTRSVYKSQPFALALFAYLGYVFLAAGMTGTGRLTFGTSFAASSRYLTPALTAWAVLLILLLARSRRGAPWSAAALALVAALLLPAQRNTLDIDVSGRGSPHTKAVGALGLQLDIHDLAEKKNLVLFYGEDFENIFRRARAARVAIFSDRFAYPADQFDRPLAEVDGEPCSGAITFQELVDEARSAHKIAGVIRGRDRKRFRYVLFGDAQGLVKGIALARRDVDGPTGPAGRAYFDGYFVGAPNASALRCVR